MWTGLASTHGIWVGGVGASTIDSVVVTHVTPCPTQKNLNRGLPIYIPVASYARDADNRDQ